MSTDTTPPAAPAALVATPADGAVTLDWADNADADLAGYRLYRGDVDASWPGTAVYLATASAATDSGLVNGTAYAWRVTAVDTAGNESQASDVATAIPVPPPPAPLCSSRSVYTDAVMEVPGPVGYWRLEEAAGTSACDSAGSSNGMYRNNPQLAQPSLITGDTNSSVGLEGAKAYVNVPSTAALSPSGPFSLEAWVSPAGVSVSQTVIRKDGQYLLRLLSRSVFFRIWWSDSTYTELTSPEVMEESASQHLVASYDGSEMRLYRNGSPIATKAVAKELATGSKAIFIGQSGGYDYFAGRLDEVAQHPRALSATAVSTHFLAGRAGEDNPAPATPTGLRAAAGDASVTLDWDDNAEADLSAFRVYRRNDDGSWPSSPVKASMASATVDTGLANGTAYEYRVTAVDLSGNESGASSPFTVTPTATPPAAPVGLTATGGAHAIGLRWQASPRAVEYRIYRRRADGTWPATALSAVTSPNVSFVDKAPFPVTTYRVTAVDGTRKESPPSAEVTGSLAAATLLVAGDTAGCDTSGDKATAAPLDREPGPIATLSDSLFAGGTSKQFADCHDPTWGRQLWRTPPPTGDHEYIAPDASGELSSFGAAAGDDPSRGYYSFDQAGWHIVVLTITCGADRGCQAGSPQEQWLRQDLAAHRALCTVAVVPGARFSPGTVHGSDLAMEPFWLALYDAGADVVLSADEHPYERFRLQNPTGVANPVAGIRQLTVGTGGRDHYAFGTALPTSQVRKDDTFGLLRLTLKPGRYDWAFLPQAGRTFTDSGSGTCH